VTARSFGRFCSAATIAARHLLAGPESVGVDPRLLELAPLVAATSTSGG
jgi:hypothetical protein